VESILDYGILEWQHIMKMIKKQSKEEGELLEIFNKVWWPHVICAWDGQENQAVLLTT
jgi:hypothetical protein